MKAKDIPFRALNGLVLHEAPHRLRDDVVRLSSVLTLPKPRYPI